MTEAGLRLRQARWAEARGSRTRRSRSWTGHARRDTAKRVLADALRYHDIAAGELEGDAAMTNLPRALELYDQTGDELVQGEGAQHPRGARVLPRRLDDGGGALRPGAHRPRRGRRRRRRRDRIGERRGGPHRPGPHRRGPTARRRRAARLRGIRQSLSRRVRHGLRGRDRAAGGRHRGARERPSARPRTASPRWARRMPRSTRACGCWRRCSTPATWKRRAELAERARSPRRRTAPRAPAGAARGLDGRCREAASS